MLPYRVSVVVSLFWYNFPTFSIHFYGTYEKGLMFIDMTMACDISINSVFLSTKTIKIITIRHISVKCNPAQHQIHHIDLPLSGVDCVTVDVVKVRLCSFRSFL